MSFKSIIILLVAVTLVGCKLSKQKSPETNQIPGYRVGDTIRDPRFLDSTEKISASRICRDLRSKRNRWEVSRDSVNFNYNVRSRSTCSGSLASYELNAGVEISGGDLVLDTTSGAKFVTEVLTDFHPALKNICDEVLADEADIENTVEIAGTRYQATFYEYNSSFYSLITRFLKEGDTWRAVLVDESLVIVNERTSNGSLVGVVGSRTQEASCTSGGSTYVTQSIR